ncbi:MAG TPA: hypothetical protein VF219_17780 [Vicinamibacterales bacterium]
MSLPAARGQLGNTFDDLVREPAIGYFTTPPSDPVARLKQRLDAGEVQLTFDPAQGYLRPVLDALKLSTDSQILVYSKTSVQSVRVNPRNPRALYFDDGVAVGYIRGADYLEFAAQDPRQGTIFYTLDQKPAARPTIERRDFCLQCHYAYATLGVAGMLDRSVVTSQTGLTLPQFGNYVTDHRSPFAERWAGYYVTSTNAPVGHLGNALVTRDDPEAGTAHAQAVPALGDRFEADAYPSPHSDMAALMVFDHQMRMMNLIARVGWEMRVAEARKNASTSKVQAMAGELVDYMLFVDEAPLPARVQGTSKFAARFSAQGPRDRRGRSLRELALDGRLMRYPCSYMVYSDAFDALPSAAREAIYRRLWDVLSSADRDGRYARLSASDRHDIIDIVRDTKSDLPSYFR